MDEPDPEPFMIDPPLSASENAVLSDLTHAADHVRDLLSHVERQTVTLQKRETEVAQLRQRVIDLEAAEAARAGRLLEAERQAAQEHNAAQEARDSSDALRVRAERLDMVLRDMHRTFFTGNVYDLILKAALSITGATRGAYLTLPGDGSIPRFRAVIGLCEDPQTTPSPFLQAACRQVIQSRETLIANDDASLAQLAELPAQTERLHNCIVTPVSLKNSLNGVIIAADKPGEFSDEDEKSVLAIGNQAGVAEENSRLRQQLQEAYLATVSVMADAMEAKDSYTQGHCEMVSRFSRLIAFHLNLSDLERSIVMYAALLHDIGKIGVSDGLLNKPGPLTGEERELVRAHVRLGHDLIRHVPALIPVADAVLYHHERYDGTGYPAGLSGDDIPIAARIVCVVDAYSAMITRRSYKDAYSEDRARAELERCAGSQFDPRVVEAFLYVLSLPSLNDIEEDDEIEWLPIFHLAGSDGAKQASAG